jgi:NAD(P)H-flavin reductase
MTFILLSNIFWVVAPVLSRIYNDPMAGMEMEDSEGAPMDTSLTTRQILDKIAGWAGMAGIWDAGFAILFAIRENGFSKSLMGKEVGQYHKGIKYHIVWGYYSFFMLTLHSVYFMIAYACDGTFALDMFPWNSPYGYWNFAGLVSWVALLVMVSTSIYKVRRLNYRLFYWTHQLYIIFMLFSFIHYYICWFPLLGPLIYLIFDRLVPQLKNKRSSMARITEVSSELMRVDFTIDTSYEPGAWVNILLPQVSNINWHPFSIASVSEASSGTATIFIKKRRNWSSQLFDVYGGGRSQVIPIKVDGPFAAKSEAYLESDSAIFAAAGTGLAALIPFIEKYASTGKSAHVYWVSRHLENVLPYTEFFDLMKRFNNIQVHLFVTGTTDVHHGGHNRKISVESR